MPCLCLSRHLKRESRTIPLDYGHVWQVSMSHKTLQQLFPRASPAFLAANEQAFAHLRQDNETTNQRKLPHPKPQPHQTPALDAANARKTPGFRRARIRFTGYRVKPLDPDNFAGSCKDLLDGLRHAGLISGDEPWRIVFETAQEKVATFRDERTVIEIEVL